MKLRPVSAKATPPYPIRSASELPRWARRAGAAVGAALLLGASGCYGVTALHELDDPEVDTTGEEPPDVDPPAPTLPRLGEPGPVLAPRPGEPDEPPPPCEPEVRMSGMMAPTSFFSCDDEAIPSFEAPLRLGAGQLCGESPAWAQFDVAEPYRARVTVLPGAENTLLTVLSPDGEVAGELGPGPSCADLELTPGTWTLRAEPADPEVYPTGYFEFYVDDTSELD